MHIPVVSMNMFGVMNEFVYNLRLLIDEMIFKRGVVLRPVAGLAPATRLVSSASFPECFVIFSN